MQPDDLLGELGQHVRVQDESEAAEDPVWERLSRGELSATEDGALRARAAADPAIAELYAAYRPLPVELRERLVEQAKSELSVAPPARVLPWRRLAIAIVAPLAAAAALILFLRHPVGEQASAPLPAYALAFTGGDRTTRSAPANDDGPVELHADSRIDIVLRPSTAAPGPVLVQAFLLQGSEVHPWPVPMQRSPEGAVRISGDAGSLLGVPAGSWDLVFIVSRDPITIEPGELARAARGEGSPHPWQLLERRVRLLP
jgi:hypothetical protein